MRLNKKLTETNANRKDIKKTREANKEDLFNAIISNAAICVNHIDERGEVIASFGSGLERLGLGNLVGLKLAEIYPNIDSSLGRSTKKEVVEFIDKKIHEGKSLYLKNWIFPYETRGTGCLNVVVDITDQKKMGRKKEDLEKFNRLSVSRELRMVELKKEVNKLCRGLGQNPKYKIA